MIRSVPLPPDCKLSSCQHDANFADAYEVLIPASELSATELYRAISRETPGWVAALMRLRNQLVQPFGLKNLGDMAAVPPGEAIPGKRMGLFEVVSSSPNELVLQDNDKHLLVQLSLFKQLHDDAHDKLTLSTVVHIHNALGRLYMAFVGPAHKVIAPAVVRRAPQAVATSLRQFGA